MSMRMKKLVSFMLILAGLCGLISAHAELPELTGLWEDPDFDRAEFVILHDFDMWSDERMGEEPAGNYVVTMTWSSGSDSVDSYRMIAHEDGDGISYENGLYVSVTDDEVELLEDMGKGRFTLTEQGTLLWQDSYYGSAAEMELQCVSLSSPGAEELAENYFRPIATLTEGTAGSSLQVAQAVYDVYRFCMEHQLWLVSNSELSSNLLDAIELLTEEESAAYEENEPVVTEAVQQLLEENAEIDSTYADAGVLDQLQELREDPAVRYSVTEFLSCVMTLGNSEEP